MRNFGVVLLSGGLDSTTVAAWAKASGYQVQALTLSYGQRHDRELTSARLVAEELAIPHQVVDVSFFSNLAWHSALTNPEGFPVPADSSPTGETEIPITYVPMRNTFLMSLAAAAVESMSLNAIEVEGVPPEEIESTILIGANAIDYSGYPDCRPEFYESLQETLRLGSKLGMQYGRPMTIQAPLIGKTKSEIIRLALELGAPLEHSWSCYSGGEAPCGTCDSCRLRAKGFEESGVADPAHVGR
jgi:7-cyano-7-deazaguanine synthase